MVNASFAGREYPPNAPYAVGREKIREFALAVGAQHPAHVDVAAAQALGYVDVIAPPTFAVIIAQRAEAQFIEDPEAAVDFSRVVHADERFTHHQPIVAGQELTTIVHVDSITERSGLSMVTTRCEIHVVGQNGEAGNHVSTVISTLAVRGEV